MKKLNDMFHIEGEQLIKTSNGEPVPEDEPVFVLRARDAAALPTLQDYVKHCIELGTPSDRFFDLGGVVAEFVKYARAHPTKVPGSSHGK
jgi:hypothetical protein